MDRIRLERAKRDAADEQNRLFAMISALERENATLRELARDLRFCARESNCLKCEHGRFCDLRLDERCKELGIEVIK